MDAQIIGTVIRILIKRYFSKLTTGQSILYAEMYNFTQIQIQINLRYPSPKSISLHHNPQIFLEYV